MARPVPRLPASHSRGSHGGASSSSSGVWWQWCDHGRREPVAPAFDFAPATLTFGRSGFSGYDTCSPYQGRARIAATTVSVDGVDRGESTCGSSTLPFEVDPIFAMRATLQTRGTITWHLMGTTRLVIERAGAPTLVFARDRGGRPSTFFAPVGKLDQNEWVPETLTVKGVPKRVVQNTRSAGALTFDGKGRFRVDGGCNAMAGTVTVRPSTMSFNPGAMALNLCSVTQGPDEVDRTQAASMALLSNGQPVSWQLAGNQLRLSTPDGTVLTLKPPRLGWPPWSPTQVSTGTIGGHPYRLGVFTRVRSAYEPQPYPGSATVTSVTLVLQTLDAQDRLHSSDSIDTSSFDSRQNPISLRVVTTDTGHNAVIGLTAPPITRLVYTPKGGTAINLPLRLVPGSSGFRWFFAEVPQADAHVVGYDASGYQAATLDQPAKGFVLTR